ncbi:hypothetical protein Ciccas_011863 [Cichlidogyrus casuarinus]|uniref:G-protein coupled receptors family 1 profile domain-containing protein n=1 Tax=Cichlidogyrus casuarinus TaxID=1844966 RepID=A0ABD2PQ12_9PLAT
MVYEVILLMMIFVLPMVIICGSQLVVTRHLRKSQQLIVFMGREDLRSWSRRRQRLMRICMLMAAIFIVSWLPIHIMNFCDRLYQQEIDMDPTRKSNLKNAIHDYVRALALTCVISNPMMLFITCSSYRFVTPEPNMSFHII